MVRLSLAMSIKIKQFLISATEFGESQLCTAQEEAVQAIVFMLDILNGSGSTVAQLVQLLPYSPRNPGSILTECAVCMEFVRSLSERDLSLW